MANVKFGVARSGNVFNVFGDHETDWVFKRTLEMMSEKAAEIGECLYAASQIRTEDGESWIQAWATLAERIEKQADESFRGKHYSSAREAYLRACNYYRTAEYGCAPTHPRFHELWRKSVACFRKAAPLFTPPVQPVEIPFEGKKLPGYFWRPDTTDTPRPTLIAVGGNDSSGEEIFFTTGPAAVRRGYNYFTFEYPGHRGTVHLYPECVKRPDYEVPFAAAIDFLQTLPGVDERIALAGFSYGGYVSTRVAIHEKRIKAVIPDGPIVDLPTVVLNGMLGALIKGTPAALLDKVIRMKLRNSPMMKSFIEYSTWTWGYDTLRGEVESQAFRDHVLVDDLHKIQCPVMALVGKDEGEEMVRQARLFYDKVGSIEKRLHIFSLEEDGSNDHCQLDNFARAHQVVFDWLDEIFCYYEQLNPLAAEFRQVD